MRKRSVIRQPGGKVRTSRWKNGTPLWDEGKKERKREEVKEREKTTLRKGGVFSLTQEEQQGKEWGGWGGGGLIQKPAN